MADVQSRIERILALEDHQRRVEELRAYARALKINVLKALRENGDYSENELVVLIYDAEQRKKESRSSKIGMIVIAFFIFSVVAGAILLAYYMVAAGPKQTPAKFFKATEAEF